MENKEINYIDFDGVKYMVVDIIDNYVYTCNLDNKEDILVLEQKNVGGEVIFEEVENNVYPMQIFYEKHKDLVTNEN